MANTILHKGRTSDATAPTAGQIALREIVINAFSGVAYIKKTDGTVIPLGGSVSSIDGGSASVAGIPIAPRRDTAINWALNNPVLPDGVLAYDTTNRRMKVGNGVTAWNSLPWMTPNPDSLTTFSLNGNGTNGSNVFVDTGIYSLPASVTTGPTINTSDSQTGTGSINFPGSGKITFPGSRAFAPGLGPFTFKFWIKFQRLINYQYILGIGFSGNEYLQFKADNSNLYAMVNNETVFIVSVSINTWYHVALVRKGTGADELTLYINGTALTPVTNAADLSDTSHSFILGTDTNNSWPFQGKVDGVSFSKFAEYLTNFTP